MSVLINLFRSVLFFSFCGFCFQSMSDDGSMSLPMDAIEKHYLATRPISSPTSAEFIASNSNVQKEVVLASVSKVKVKFKTRSIASMYDPVESLKKKETLVAKINRPIIKLDEVRPSGLCKAVKNGRGLNFKTPTTYLSSVLKKAGAIPNSEPLFSDHADLLWDKYLSKNNFEDVSASLDDGDFKFENLKNGSLIVLEKSCFKEGTVAVYCDGKYFATKFVKTSSLLKKVNSKSSSCQLGKGMRIVVEKTSPSSVNPETLAKAY